MRSPENNEIIHQPESTPGLLQSQLNHRLVQLLLAASLSLSFLQACNDENTRGNPTEKDQNQHRDNDTQFANSDLIPSPLPLPDVNSPNAQRSKDVETILEALVQHQADTGSPYTTVANITADSYYQIGTCLSGGDSGCIAKTTQSACIDLSDIGPNYLATVPKDPQTGTADETSYYIMRHGDETTVGACTPEIEDGKTPKIEVTR